MASRAKSRALSAVALAFGVLLTAGGLFFLGTYLAGVVEILIDQPSDRSWLFWGLGMAFIGITLLVGGAALVVVWRKTRSGPDPD